MGSILLHIGWVMIVLRIGYSVGVIRTNQRFRSQLLRVAASNIATTKAEYQKAREAA